MTIHTQPESHHSDPAAQTAQDALHALAEQAFARLYDYVQSRHYDGWDVFDGLNSRLLQATPLYRSALVRLAWIQAFKRSPLNLRGLTGVPRQNNAKGIALFAAGLIRRGELEEARTLIERLCAEALQRRAGSAWGYNFPWESRAFFVPVGTPNVVSTVFVANTLLDYHEATGDRQALDTARAAADFILDELLLHEDDAGVCFGYIPGAEARVHNASMMAAALLARVNRHHPRDSYLEKSRKAMAYAIRALRPDHSWPYGERHHHQFVDNFHTGFNLVALHDWMKYSGDRQWLPQLRAAYGYFIEQFWLPDGCPKYYHDSLYPIDIHCSAQGIVTCVRLHDIDPRSAALAERIARWAITRMQSKQGCFHYQITRLWTNRIPYIRWSQAWMFYALALLTTRLQAGRPDSPR